MRPGNWRQVASRPLCPRLAPSQQLWSCQGECLATLPGAALPAGASSNTIFISDAQDLAFVYSPPALSPACPSVRWHPHLSGEPVPARPYEPATPHGEARLQALQHVHQGERQEWEQAARRGHGIDCKCRRSGGVRVFDLLRGRQVAEVTAPPPPPPGPLPGAATKADAREAQRAAAADAALCQVTAVLYDEASHRLYTGGADGRVQAWWL